MRFNTYSRPSLASPKMQDAGVIGNYPAKVTLALLIPAFQIKTDY